MITGDQLAIGKETGRRLGMGTNMYPSSALLGESKDESSSALPVDDLCLDICCSESFGSLIFHLSSPFLMYYHEHIKRQGQAFSTDPSPLPDSWKLSEIFATEVVLGSYLALMTVLFFYAANETNFFTKHFHARVRDFNQHHFNMLD
ncbi:hypothetical protein LWI29_022679 [Acer saccharum]|uniref:Uncharacterized protein n=1 Tax=Acer saccharum TaxID=4024 RepID=A0AA39SPT9_ACESA|nr:hypothetical protein LWI29_022679 [Acer saccharum]